MGFARAQVVWLMRANSRCKRVTIMTRDAQESRPMMSSGLGDYVRVCVCVCGRAGARGGDWVLGGVETGYEWHWRCCVACARAGCILWG